MALELIDDLIQKVSTKQNEDIKWLDKIPISHPKCLNKTESELDQHPDKLRLRKGYYHDDEGNIYQLKIVQKVESEITSVEMKHNEHSNTKNVIGDDNFIHLSQILLFGADCKRIKNGSVTGFQSLGATGGMKAFCKYIYLTYGEINVYCPTMGWNVHKKIIEDNNLIIRDYKYPFQTSNDDKRSIFVDGDNDEIKFKKGDIILLHGCAHNPTGIDPTVNEWKRVIQIIKKYDLIPFFDYAYQGFVSGDIEEDSFTIKLFEQQGVDQIFVVQSYSKNMGLYNKRIGCSSIICKSPKDAKNSLLI